MHLPTLGGRVKLRTEGVMKIVVVLAMAALITPGAYAQRGGGGHAGGARIGGGFRAGGGFRSGGGFRTGGTFRGGFRGSYGFSRPGFRGLRSFPNRYRFGFGYWWPYSFGYGYWDPFFYDSYSDYAPDYGYAASYPYSYSPSPGVTIVSNFGYPQVAPAPVPAPMYEAPPVAAPESAQTAPLRPDEPVLYLIAFNDHIIRPALAYWTQGDTLHYVTMDHAEKTAPLSSIDRDMSLRLNRERHVTFALPMPRLSRQTAH